MLVSLQSFIKTNIWLICGIVLLGCNRSIDKKKYLDYIYDTHNGLFHIQKIGPVTVECMYKPLDLIITQDIAIASVYSPIVVDSLRNFYSGKNYFTLSLACNETEIENQFISNSTAFANALSYLNSGIAHDVYLVTNQSISDSVAALVATYPRQYGTTGRSTVLLVFDTHRLDLSNGFTLTCHDTQFGLGSLRFPFTKEALNNLPKLKF